MKFNYCLGVTLFNPTDKDLKRIEEYSEIFQKIYVYDNSETKNYLSEDIVYYYNGNNDGLSVAFNTMGKDAILEGYEYMVFMDQDSKFNETNIQKIINSIEESQNEIDIIGPTIVYDTDNKLNDAEEEISEVDWIITSGSFNKLNTFLLVGGYDCRMLKEKKYKVLIHNNSILYQSLGDKTHHFGNQIYSEHSAVRNYYISRNRLYYSNKFKENGIKNILSLFRQVFLIILFDENKMEKLKEIIIGISDFRKKKFGIKVWEGGRNEKNN
jgi:rhamnosyltransferase